MTTGNVSATFVVNVDMAHNAAGTENGCYAPNVIHAGIKQNTVYATPTLNGKTVVV
jgi:hypothetical protein